MQRSIKAREQRLRRQARRMDLTIVKPRGGNTHGGARPEMWLGDYWVVDPFSNMILSDEHGMDLDGVEAWLAED
jgi:hypothetical protein